MSKRILYFLVIKEYHVLDIIQTIEIKLNIKKEI